MWTNTAWEMKERKASFDSWFGGIVATRVGKTREWERDGLSEAGSREWARLLLTLLLPFSQSGTLARVMGLDISSYSFRVALSTSLRYSWKLLPRNWKMCFMVILKLVNLAVMINLHGILIVWVSVLWLVKLFENDKSESGWEIGKMWIT